MKKIIKTSLLIIGFCLLLLIFSNSNVQAVDEDGNITTVQELQEVMGAKAYSIIEGTTLKITNDFTWKISTYEFLKIPELTIDFNGKKITIDNDTVSPIEIRGGKIILKDTAGETGGFHFSGGSPSRRHLEIQEGAELIVENGQYTSERSRMFYCCGGKITIKNGIFKCDLIEIVDGTAKIEDGTFECESYMISIDGLNYEGNSIEFIMNGGKYVVKSYSVLHIRAGKTPMKVDLKGGEMKTSFLHCVDIYAYYKAEDGYQATGKITIDGCNLVGDNSALHLEEGSSTAFKEVCDIDIKNGTLKTSGEHWDGYGAIYGEFLPNSNSGIKKIISNYDREVFDRNTSLDATGKVKYKCESTYAELVFKDGKLVSARNPGDNTGDKPGDGTVTTPTVMYDSKKVQIGTDVSLQISSNKSPAYTVNKIESSDSNYQKLTNGMNGIIKSNNTTLGAFRTEVTGNGDRLDVLNFEVGTKYNGKYVFIGYLNKNLEYKYYEGTVKDGQVSVTIKDGIKAGMIALRETYMSVPPGEETIEDDKLPQTGEETNRFAGWLSTAIVLGIVWLGSMLLIDREKKKMAKR